MTTTTNKGTVAHSSALMAGFLAMAMFGSWANTKRYIGRWAGCYQKQGRYVGVQPHIWRYFFGAKQGDAIYHTSQGDVFFHAPSKTSGGHLLPILPRENYDINDEKRGFWLCDHNHDYEYVWSDEDGDEIKHFTYTHTDNCADLAFDPAHGALARLTTQYYTWVDALANADGERSEWTQKLVDTCVIDSEVKADEISFVFSTVESFLKACGKAKQAFERAEKAVGRVAVPEHLYGARALITGTITERKTEWTDYGEQTKLTIRDDRGFDVIVTAPKSIRDDAFEGIRVKLEATISEWNKVEGLTYAKRPSKGVILS